MTAHPTHDDLYPTSKGKYRDLVPAGTKHYLRETLVFTDYTQQLILDFVRMGEHVGTACRIAGVSPSVLTTWLRKGRTCTDETDAYYHFFIKYKHARLKGLKLLREKQQRRRADPQGYGDMPMTTLRDNPLPLSLFTEENRRAILSSIQQGAFPGVAAEAAGVPAAIFHYWLEEGKRDLQQGNEEGDFLGFYLDCMKIGAQARAVAEVHVYEDQPLAWLLHGPGRDGLSHETVGWAKQQQITGANGGPVSVVTEWRGAQLPLQALPEAGQSSAIEGIVTTLGEEDDAEIDASAAQTDTPPEAHLPTKPLDI